MSKTEDGKAKFDVGLSVGLGTRKSAHIQVMGYPKPGVILNLSFPFDPPGSQTEEELRKLARAEAKDILKDLAGGF